MTRRVEIAEGSRIAFPALENQDAARLRAGVGPAVGSAEERNSEGLGVNVIGDAFTSELARVAAQTEALLGDLLGTGRVEGEIARPERLREAMRYASLGGGKRIRPFLLVASADLFDVPRGRSLLAGAALECVHGYSLVHDDLPAMDNDDLRRGRPTAHKAFDEATAILAGDGLLTLAFDLLSRPEVHPAASARIALIQALSRAAGLGGMVGGQMLDLAAEGRFDDGRPQKLEEEAILTLQAMKTGALLRFACAAGAILGEAGSTERLALERFGALVGEAFQIADDLLDVEGDPATLGKAAHKDAEAGKATLVGILGLDAAKARLEVLVARAEATLSPFGERAGMLFEAARFIANRRA
jgi:farnesyl diphosphate synthase